MWIEILILIGVFWTLQLILAYFQGAAIQKNLKEMNKSGFVGVGIQRGKITGGVYIILASDESGGIIDARIMQGVTVFVRFKRFNNVIGKNAYDLLSEKEESGGGERDGNRKKALFEAAKNLCGILDKAKIKKDSEV